MTTIKLELRDSDIEQLRKLFARVEKPSHAEVGIITGLDAFDLVHAGYLEEHSLGRWQHYYVPTARLAARLEIDRREQELAERDQVRSVKSGLATSLFIVVVVLSLYYLL